jgi:peroxiredoxin
MAVIDENGKASVKIIEFSKCEIFDEDGNKIKIVELWQKQTVIFIFLRHFGCVSCRAHAVQIWRDRENYQRGGAKIIFIGNGSPQFIKIFKEDLNIKDAPVFTDPSLASFRAVGFRRGFLAALGPKSLLNGRKLFKEGHKQGESFNRETGDLWQLGGVVAINPDGRVGYHYISLATGDFPPEKDLQSIQDRQH